MSMLEKKVGNMIGEKPLNGNLLTQYLTGLEGADINPATLAFLASLDQISRVAPSVAKTVIQECVDQRRSLKLVASENYSSLATQLAHANLFVDKSAEGTSQHRFSTGCGNVDAIELEASSLACELFGADHAYLQPHSGADANLVAFAAILSAKVQRPLLKELGQENPMKVPREKWAKVREALQNQRLLAMDYASGGHLTHGYRHNISSYLFDAYFYSVDPLSKQVDLDQLRTQLHEVRPLVLIAGYSAYPRKLNFAKMRELADEVGAVFMVDMAHFAGLVAGKVFTGDFDPVAHAHIVTSTTNKTLRGPRGGIVLCKQEFAEWVDKGSPSVLSAPLPHVMVAKAVALHEALTPEFRTYAQKVVENAQVLAEACMSESMEVVSKGTDNHIVLIDVAETFGITGRHAELALQESGITLGRNVVPFDQKGWYTSGIRIGTPSVTTLGMGTEEMKEIAKIIKGVLSNVVPMTIMGGGQKAQKSLAKYTLSTEITNDARKRVGTLLDRYPPYPDLDLDWILAQNG